MANYIHQLQGEREELMTLVRELLSSLDDIRDYCASDKYQPTDSEPIVTMNPQDIIRRVNDAKNALFYKHAERCCDAWQENKADMYNLLDDL